MEPNTDRLYWTIGVIIIGAIIVGAAKIAFPDLFDSVVSYMKSQILGSAILSSKLTSLYSGFKIFG
ncbi:hypothetical protein LSG23_20260 (plasmid) [Bacillus velezensis]|uniref:hypothetical protein n=1 Tax=Bacillus velezensis TaxID=492670 RepID=UPI000987F380|nr:hypothetical protein [Bacillus velezensis]AQS42458.1 hypothetical protein BVH55_00230 [Bacillus velezensis]WNR83260.1 hypothetical protein RP314_20590 [Bacillus velezensis]